jgi:hypothetical protein
MWADVLTKPLQGQKFRDMHAFLQNCSKSYDDNIELQTDKLVQKSLKQQVETVASLRECVGVCMKNAREKGGGNKSPCCVSWADETRAVSHEKTRQGSTLRHAMTSLEGIQKQKPRGQTMWTKDTNNTRRYAHVAKRYARNNGESNQVSTR